MEVAVGVWVAGSRVAVGVSVGVGVPVRVGVGVSVPVGVMVGVSVGTRVPVGVAVGVCTCVAVGDGVIVSGGGVALGVDTTVGKDWVGVGSRVAVGVRGVETDVGVRVTDGVTPLAGGRVARGVTVRETAGGAVTNAVIPRQ